jgi:hypothetical protein
MERLTGNPEYPAVLANTSQASGGNLVQEDLATAAQTAVGSDSAVDRTGAWPGLHGVVDVGAAMETKPLPDNPIEINNPVTDADRAIPSPAGFTDVTFGPPGGFPEQATEGEDNIAVAEAHNASGPMPKWTGRWQQT